MVYRRRKEQIPLQQKPKGVQMCSLMPESHLAKVRPLARGEESLSPGGLIVTGSGDSSLLLDFWGLPSLWSPV